MALARASEQFRQSDVTTWGIVALVLGGIAVMGANVSAVLPQNLMAGLHRTRIEGASVEQLRDQVGDLRLDMQSLRRENSVLTTRLNLGEQQSGDMIRRVGALEVSLPNLLEMSPGGAGVDRSNVTAAIGGDPAVVYDTDGGSVMIRQQPMAELQPGVPIQPLPAPVEQVATASAPSATTYGIALGPAIATEQAPQAWRDLNMKLGPLLFGLAPVLADESSGNNKRIVVGPIAQLAEASALCGRLERVSVSCMPVPFTGTPLAY